MKDQVDGLRARGVAAAALHSGMLLSERQSAEAALADGRLKLIYVAPERLGHAALPLGAGAGRRRPGWWSTRRTASASGATISGRTIAGSPSFRSDLGVPAAAFTATATPEVRADIAEQLGLHSPLELVTGFERPNLTLAVERCRGREEKRAALERLVREVGLPGIVYAATRKSVELWSGMLADMGLRTGRYHAGMTDEERTRAQEDFLAGRVDVIVATNAFGMGVDKADIRFVAHAELPGSVEAYYQEVGRAGRDGLPSRCTLLLLTGGRAHPGVLPRRGQSHRRHVPRGVAAAGSRTRATSEIEERSGGEAQRAMAAATAPGCCGVPRRAPVSNSARALRRWTWKGGALKARRDRERLDTMVRYAFSRGCRTRFIYDYFAGGARGGAAPRCGVCDVCLGWRRGAGRLLDESELLQVRIALSGVGRLSGRFGVERVAQVLVGSKVRGSARPRPRPDSDLREAGDNAAGSGEGPAGRAG